MGKLFTLDAGTKAVIASAFDDLITELGKNCRLQYPPKWTTCINCIADTAGQRSSNHWLTGGPIPFPNGQICPMCNGAFRRAETVSETLQLLCAWDPRNFFRPIPGMDIRVPFAVVQTKGFLSDLPKLERADCMFFETDIEGIARRKYKLAGEPGDPSNIIQGRYCIATWERKG